MKYNVAERVSLVKKTEIWLLVPWIAHSSQDIYASKDKSAIILIATNKRRRKSFA